MGGRRAGVGTKYETYRTSAYQTEKRGMTFYGIKRYILGHSK